MSLLADLALVLAALSVVPVAILAVQCLAALLPTRRAPEGGPRPAAVVLVPAHDEEDLLAESLESIQADLAPGDRVRVIAHNCSDGTADEARRLGAEVFEAHDDGSLGKPGALVAGLASLDEDPPEVVVIIDADCRVERGSIDALVRGAARHRGPVQGVYLFAPPDGGSVSSISSLALLVKNRVRPTGLHNLGLPCLLNGAGSAYPFEELRHAPHGQGSIAEDYQLSIDLALGGHPTRFVPEAHITSTLPARRDTAYKQRKRWEHGHLQLFLQTAPRLLGTALRRGSPALLSLALDLLVPPLSFLVLGWLAAAGLSLAVLLLGAGELPMLVSAAGGAGLAVALLAAFLRYAGPRATLAVAFRVPGYVLWKIPLYLAYAFRRETRWKKTERG